MLVDLENYFCNELSIRLGASAGAAVTVRWAESLFDDPGFRNRKAAARSTSETSDRTGHGRTSRVFTAKEPTRPDTRRSYHHFVTTKKKPGESGPCGKVSRPDRPLRPFASASRARLPWLHLSRSTRSGDQGLRTPSPCSTDAVSDRLHKVIFRAALHQGQHRSNGITIAIEENGPSPDSVAVILPFSLTTQTRHFARLKTVLE
jgi:hypothetical protein